MAGKTKTKGNSAWADRPCAYVKCKKFYPPTTENQKFHIRECQMTAFYLRKIEGPKGEQIRWEREVRRIAARVELEYGKQANSKRTR